MRPLKALAVDLRRVGMALLVAAIVLAMFFPEQVTRFEAAAMAVLGIAAWLGGLWLAGRAGDSP